MIDQIKSIYATCGLHNCDEIVNNSFYLNDHNDGRCNIAFQNNNATCFINNKNNSSILFVAVDECLIPQSAGIKKCDALIEGNGTIWFIELKEVNWSVKSSTNRTKRKNGRLKAVQQLGSTILDFKNKGIDFSSHKVVALISFPPFTDIESPISIPSTSSQERLLEFISICGFSDLYEGNHIVI